MIAYLSKIIKEMVIEIDLQRIWVKICARLTSIFCSFPLKQAIIASIISFMIIIYHKNLSNFFPKYPNTHLGNTLLVNNMPYEPT